MIKVVIDGFNSHVDAKAFVDWFILHGKDEASRYFKMLSDFGDLNYRSISTNQVVFSHDDKIDVKIVVR